MSRLSIEITESQHQRIKALAALRGVSLKDFILERTLAKADEADGEEEALEELERLLAPRIEEALAGKVSKLTVTEVAERAFRRAAKKRA